ncbi:MAG: pyrimidine 5'-nucleotidase [Chloroflexota bacterium]|nr:MAG: pyrimidine 5'-nucleotidase [Chloroflexota bacterium]
MPMKKFETLFFDLDATLYSPSSGLWKLIKNRIAQYTMKCTGLPETEAQQIREVYLEKYGTTLAGLQRHYQVDTKDYLDYVHNVPLANYITPNPQLRVMLESLPQKKWVFTNSDMPHVERVLGILGIEDLFSGVADVYALDFNIKPMPEAYERTLAMAGNPDPQTCVLLDDRIENLVTAGKMGFYTVLVNVFDSPNGSQFNANLHIQDLLDLPAKMPELWDVS